jgi:hypothetical protein
MTVVPAFLPDTVTPAGFDHLDPITQWFRGGSGTAGATATGISDDTRYGLDLQNSGLGGQSLRATSGNGTYGVRVNNTGAVALGGWLINGNLNVTGTGDFTGLLTAEAGFAVTTGVSTFGGPVTMASTLAVAATSTFSGLAQFNGTVTMASALRVTGAVTLLGTLDATGAATFRGTTDTTGAATFRSTVVVASDVTASGNTLLRGTLQVLGTQDFTGAATFRSTLTALQFGSTVAGGTPPYSCTSTTLNTNLNADMVDGIHGTSFARIDAATDFTTPPTIQGDAVAKITTGSYTGNGSTQALTGFGFAPKTVLIMDTGTGTVYGCVQNGISIFVTSGGATGNSTASMGSDGITLLAAAGLNVNTHTYAYVALG